LFQGNSWLLDLAAPNYAKPLPPSLPAVQATLALIIGFEIHDFVHATDRAALLDTNDDGKHVPFLLTTLDLFHWTSIIYLSTLEGGVKRALTRLREAHAVLVHLLEKDELDLEEANTNTHLVESALHTTNPHEDWSDRPTPTRATDSVSSLHPIVGRLNIPQTHQVALEDFGESIQSTQMDQEMVSQDSSGKGSTIPFLPPHTIEIRLNARSHRT
jgi:hypothetical protein